MSLQTKLPLENTNYHNKLLAFIKNASLDKLDYQIKGILWSIWNEIRPQPLENVRGGIIADEMGLGKTITIISLIYCNFKPHTLIILPKILVQQWKNAFIKFTNHNPLIFCSNNKKNITYNQLLTAKIIITTYDTIIHDKDDMITSIKWNRIVCDEAHHIKNKKTKKHKYILNLKSDIKWMVTGTPIQNKKKDIMALCKIIGFKQPSCYLKQIKQKFIIRRTKNDVGIKMPNLNITNVNVQWKPTIAEQKIAIDIHSLFPNASLCAYNKAYYYANIYKNNRTKHLIGMMRARQLCISSELLNSHISELKNNGYDMPINYIEMNYSSKLNKFFDLIESRKNNNNGKIIFCNFRKEIDIIKNKLEMIGFNNVYKYDGRNNKKQMDDAIENAQVLILQIQTSCEGLNLQNNFSEIYIVTPDWNPAIENQSIARCHRIGQEKNVEVFKFIMNTFGKSTIKKNENKENKENKEEQYTVTIDSYINNMQIYKQKIANKFFN